MVRHPVGPVRRTTTLLAGVAAAMAAVALGGHVSAARATTPARLMAVSSQVSGRTTSLLIRSSEPVAYSTTRPDPLTLVVNLRSVVAAGFASDFPAVPQDPIRSIAVEDAKGPDGPVARVTPSDRRATPCRRCLLDAGPCLIRCWPAPDRGSQWFWTLPVCLQWKLPTGGNDSRSAITAAWTAPSHWRDRPRPLALHRVAGQGGMYS